MPRGSSWPGVRMPLYRQNVCLYRGTLPSRCGELQLNEAELASALAPAKLARRPVSARGEANGGGLG